MRDAVRSHSSISSAEARPHRRASTRVVLDRVIRGQQLAHHRDARIGRARRSPLDRKARSTAVRYVSWPRPATFRSYRRFLEQPNAFDHDSFVDRLASYRRSTARRRWRQSSLPSRRRSARPFARVHRCSSTSPSHANVTSTASKAEADGRAGSASPVCFAAMIPASCAATSASPFGSVASRTAFAACRAQPNLGARARTALGHRLAADVDHEDRSVGGDVAWPVHRIRDGAALWKRNQIRQRIPKPANSTACLCCGPGSVRQRSAPSRSSRALR